MAWKTTLREMQVEKSMALFGHTVALLITVALDPCQNQITVDDGIFTSLFLWTVEFDHYR